MVKLLLVLTALTACGGDDGMQMCGADHCGLQGHTVVKWMFDAYPTLLFQNDSCVDFGVVKVRVDAQADADGKVTTLIDDCGLSQVTFDGLADGTYTMFVDAEDGDLSSVLSGPVTMDGVAAGQYQADTSATLNVPWTSWVGSFNGTFLYRLSWMGQGCATATTPVVTQKVTLMQNGVVVPVTTDDGEVLDGTAFPCYDLGANFPQSAKTVPFGPTTLVIEGLDSTSAVVYTSSIDTFVGAGITNPTITYPIQPAM
jgi:hypothetical protein